jgi:hypothetical protein
MKAHLRKSSLEVSDMLVITGNTSIYFDEKPDSLAIEELY